MKLTITAKHIKEGRKCKCRKCPLALALLDAGFETALAAVDYLYATKNHHSYYFKHSQQSYDFMTSFDRGKVVFPQTLELLEQVD